ncbi:MAG: hypothetical protein RLZZ192_1209 [Pseudomonadota bacterium]|jgi:hypothetical protein
MTVKKPALSLALLVVFVASVTGCAQVSSAKPGTPIAQVLKQYGKPAVTCPTKDGGQRMVWTQQPEGETAYAVQVPKSGLIEAPQQVLSTESFNVMSNGEVWTREMVHCQFGPPANISRDGIGSEEWIWGYRYMAPGDDAQMMYVYLGSTGASVTRYVSLPDPERNPEVMGRR